MAATLKTPNYKYPVYAENDITSWADFNSLADGVDRDIHNVSQIVQEEKGKTEELITEMSEVKEQVARASQDAGEAKSQVAAINVRVENAETHLNDVDNQIELLQAAQETQAGSIASLEHSVNTVERNITATASNVETLTQRVNNTSDLVGQHSTDIAQLKQDVSGYEERIATIESEVNEISGEVASAEADILSVQTRISNLERRTASSEETINFLNEAVNQEIKLGEVKNFAIEKLDYVGGSYSKLRLKASTANINVGDIFVIRLSINRTNPLSSPNFLAVMSPATPESKSIVIGGMARVTGTTQYKGDIIAVVEGDTSNRFIELIIIEPGSTDLSIPDDYTAYIISATPLKLG